MSENRSVWPVVLLLTAAACGGRTDESAPAAAGAASVSTAGVSAPAAGQGARPVAGGGGAPSLSASGGAGAAGNATAGASVAAAGAGAAAVGGTVASVAGAGSGGASAGVAGTANVPIETSQACPASTLKAGDSTRMVAANDRMRSYLLHVPSGYTGSQPVPVVFDFHGYSSSARGQMGVSGFRELADAETFLAVYPEGVGASWHVNGCCGTAGDMKLDEIAFVRAIFDDLKSTACLDLNHVYASGISQGGGMAHHVGCLAADIFAGTAPVSSDLRTEPCAPARPVTEISFRGLADSLDAYEGGHVGPPGMEGYTAIGAKPTLERWKTIDMCTGATEKMNDICETYTMCAEGVAVSLCSLPGADHVLYENAQNLSVPKVSWELFKKHHR